MKRGPISRCGGCGSIRGSILGRLSVLPLALLVSLALVGGCKRGGDAVPWPNPPMPDGSTPLRPGMTRDELRQVMGADGTTLPPPRDGGYKEGLEFIMPPKYPDAHLLVAIDKDNKVVGWTALRPLTYGAPQGQ